MSSLISSSGLDSSLCYLKCLLVIPAFCETERLPPYLRALATEVDAHFPCTRILVVDDGSPRAEAEKLCANIREIQAQHSAVLAPVCLSQNVGKGGAILRGWQLGEDYEALGFFDADGAISPHEVGRLIRLFSADSSHTALFGSRLRQAGRIVKRSFLRHLIGRCYALLTNLLVDNSLHDTQCGAKIISDRAYRKIAPLLDGMRFAFDVELLAALKSVGEPLKEVPIDWQHVAGSKINFFSDTIHMMRSLVAIRSKLKRWV